LEDQRDVGWRGGADGRVHAVMRGRGPWDVNARPPLCPSTNQGWKVL
jgi:hypothetical protein